jgi:hypothetical protein
LPAELFTLAVIVFGMIGFNMWFAWAVYYHSGRSARTERLVY